VTLVVRPALARSIAGFDVSVSLALLPWSSVGVGAGLTQPIFVPPLARAAELGEKIRSSLPVLHISKPFQRYYRKDRELREGHSVQWNEVLLADSLAASKTPVYITNKETVAASPTKISAGSVKKGFLREGFLNPHPAVIAPTAHSLLVELGSHLPREVKVVGVVGLRSPLSCHIISSSVEGNGFSQSQEWLVGFDSTGEVVFWEKDDEFWDGMPFGLGDGWCLWRGVFGNPGCHGRRISSGQDDSAKGPKARGSF
jgi:hypothetical protein